MRHPWQMLLKAAAALVVLTTGYTWTVGQTGVNQTNKNLCELGRQFYAGLSDNCEIPRLFAWAWGALFLAACAYLLYVAGHFASKRLFAKEPSASEMNSKSLARIKERVQPETNSSSSFLKITTGEDGQYFKTKSENLYKIRRILNLKLENISREQAISDIKLTLLSIEPQSDYVGPWTFASGLTLAAGDHNFIPFVSFGEADSSANYSTSRYDRSDSFYVFLTNNPDQPSGPKETPQYFHVRATGIGTAPCEYRGKVWVDQPDGQLRIADVDADDRPHSGVLSGTAPDFTAQSAGTGLKQQLLDSLERNRQARAAASAELAFKEVHDDFSRIMIEHEKGEGKTDIRLRFLPDGDQPATKALLVLCLLYRKLRSQKLGVRFANAEVAWLCAHAPNAPGTSIARNQIYIHAMMGGTVDYGKEAIDRGYLIRTGLASGGFYELTRPGEEYALSIARGMIRQA